jgi:hypothetical protein
MNIIPNRFMKILNLIIFLMARFFYSHPKLRKFVNFFLHRFPRLRNQILKVALKSACDTENRPPFPGAHSNHIFLQIKQRIKGAK